MRYKIICLSALFIFLSTSVCFAKKFRIGPEIPEIFMVKVVAVYKCENNLNNNLNIKKQICKRYQRLTFFYDVEVAEKSVMCRTTEIEEDFLAFYFDVPEGKNGYAIKVRYSDKPGVEFVEVHLNSRDQVK